MVAEHVTHVLAQEALDALTKFLDPFDIHLRHAPGPVGRIRRSGLEGPDALFRAEIPRDVGDEISDRRKRAHRLYRDGLGKIELVQPRHAHEARTAVHFGRARPALARLAVPAHREIV